MQRKFQLRSAALHLELERLAGLDQQGQDQVQHLAGDLDLGAAIGRRADDLAVQHLAGLQGKRLQRTAASGGNELGELIGDRHGVPAPAAPRGALV